MYDIPASENRRNILKNFVPPATGFFSRGAEILAPALLGCLLRKETDEGFISGIVVETEAYTGDDPASHSFRGRTERNGVMFERGGLAYVYLVYGVHNCFNITSGIEGIGEAVLIRAVRPHEGIELMKLNRGVVEIRHLCNGPGKLCQAFGIDRRYNGKSLENGEIRLYVPVAPGEPDISVTGRIGISRGVELQRRFTLENSRWVSSVK